jgi:pyruvate,water dikinase
MPPNHSPPKPGQAIPLPSDFPVQWSSPDDAKLFWQQDRAHFESPIAPLAAEVIALLFNGFNAAAEQFGLPVRLRFARFNTYIYLAFFPTIPLSETVIKTLSVVNRVAPGLAKAAMNRMASAQAKPYVNQLNPVVARLGAWWHDELLPEVKQHLACMESCDLRGATLAQLRAQLNDHLKRAQHLGELRFRAVLPASSAMSQFEELYRELCKGASQLDALKLTQGFDNQSLETERALWQLGRVALTMPTVKQTVEACAATNVIPVLEKSDEGRCFLIDLRAYLQKYGQRSHVFDAFSQPSWIEDPTAVIKNLKDYIAQPERNLDAARVALAIERERMVNEARQKLRGHPQSVVTQFETLLKAAQVAAVIQADRTHWIDQRALYQLRRIALELGRRLHEAHALETTHDVFYLTLDELRAMPPSPLQGEELGVKVRHRQAEMQRFSAITPPPLLGALPPFDTSDAMSFIHALW